MAVAVVRVVVVHVLLRIVSATNGDNSRSLVISHQFRPQKNGKQVYTSLTLPMILYKVPNGTA